MKKNNSEEVYKAHLEDLRNSFTDPSQSQNELRENGLILLEEYTAILANINTLRPLKTDVEMILYCKNKREAVKLAKGIIADIEATIAREERLLNEDK